MNKESHHRKRARTREKVSGLAAFSFFVYLLDTLTDKVYEALANGFFGKILTAYSAEQAAFESGFVKNHFISKKFKRYFRLFRQFLSKSFESSLCLNQVKRLSRKMLLIPLKSYGVSLFFFGLYTVMICLIRWVVPGLTEAGAEYILIGVSTCIVSIPLLISYDSLAEASGKSMILGSFLRDVFGLREEAFEGEVSSGRGASNLLLCFGMLMGLLTLFVHPFTILLACFAVVIMGLIFTAPEIGVLLAIFLLPFLSFFQSPALILAGLILVTTVSYLIKLVCGKRILRFELLDLAVVLFWLLLYFSGVISAGGSEGYPEVLLSCALMLGYFLAVNLLRTERWLNRCVLALTSSGTVVAIIGVFQYAFGTIDMAAWLDTSYFYDIDRRAVSLFENPNVLGAYLIIVLPFALYCATRAYGAKKKLLIRISIALILICLVLTWSRGAWIAALVEILIFSLLYSKKTTRFLVLLCACIPVLSFLIPQTVIRRFTSIGSLADSSSMYRLYTWKGTWRSIQEYWLGGVGYGNTAYEQIYPQFAYAGIEAAEHSHNLFLQIWFGMGIGGLVIFLAILLLFTQMALESLKETESIALRYMVSASLCAVLASLTMGLFDFVWYNNRVFFLFWIALGVACACARVGRAEKKRHSVVRDSRQNDAVLEIDL